jgi:hypothetical protein
MQRLIYLPSAFDTEGNGRRGLDFRAQVEGVGETLDIVQSGGEVAAEGYAWREIRSAPRAPRK